jgi:phosphatidylserine/phosphatidylglycerophosphate/cardiolipin synthase-like enzyme
MYRGPTVTDPRSPMTSVHRFVRASPLILAMLFGIAAHAYAERTPSQIVLSAEQNPIDETRRLIDAAERSLDVVVYKFDDRGLRKAIERAIERGVRVRIVADRHESKGKDSQIRAVQKAGVDLRLWRRGKLHVKMLIVDERRLVTGSFNWTESAQHGNLEMLIDVVDPIAVAEARAAFDFIWSNATPS